MDHAARVARVRDVLAGTEADALLVTNLTNVRYLTGFSGTNAQLLVTPTNATFFTDTRYEARSRSLVKGADVVIYKLRLSEVLAEALESEGLRRLGIEAATMTVAGRDDLSERLPGVEIFPTSGVVEELRRVKDADEIALLRRAVSIGDDAFEWILDRLAPGRTETEIALDLEVRMRSGGADAVSFEPIVGSGPLSAHIHHTASDRIFEKGDLVLLDFGCRVGGYCSDLTRTVVLGAATDVQTEQYLKVLEAQEAGIAAIAAGAACRDVDRAARSVIESAGHGPAFGHGLGHGVGLDIHEAPRFNTESEQTLIAGDVVTVEPGIYHPDPGGIRIEDCVLVTDQGAEVLGRAPKDRLIEL